MEEGETAAGSGSTGRRYEALAAAVDGGVLEVDADGQITGVDETFVEQTGRAADDAVEEPLAALFGEDADRIERALADDADATLTVTVDGAGGASTPFELRLRGVSSDGGTGAVGVLAPAVGDAGDRAHDPAERQRILQDFHDVTTDADRTFEERAAALLSIVRETIGTEYASLSKVDGSDYTFELVDARADIPVAFGEEFTLDETNCERIVETDETVVFQDIASDAPGFADRAANTELGLSCFLGAPVVVDGDVQATLCLLGSEPRTRGFSEWEVTLVELAAEWVSYELTQQRTRERLEQRNDALQASRRRYETVVENFPNGAVALVDDDLRYVTVGGSPVDTEDSTAEDLEGKHAEDVLSPELAAVLVPRYRAALDGEASTFECEVGERATQFHIFPVYDDGEVTGAMGMSQDVTERRDRRRRIEESEQRYRTLVENFPNGAVGLFDEDLRYTAVGGELVSEGDISPEDRVGRRVHDIYPDHLVEELEPHFEAALDGDPQGFETEFDGTHLSARVLPTRGPDGDVDGGMLVVQDVTEQREREQALADAKSQMEAAAQAGAVGTWEWHVPEDRFVADASLARLFGIDPDRAREGVPLSELVASIHEDDRERVAAAIDEAVETCGEYEEEYRVYDADGDVRWVVARGYVECEDGEAVTFPGAITDITEKKRAEREIEQHREQLETLFEVLPVGVVVANADGELVEANGIAKRIWGGADFDAESVDEYDQYTAWWADSGERVEPDEYALARVLDGEPVVEPDVYDIEAADGSERVIEVRGMPVYDDGEVVRGVITMTDVTERADRDRTLERRAHQQRVVADLGQRALEADDLDELMVEATRRVADVLDNEYGKVLDLDESDGELLMREGAGWREDVVGSATIDADAERSQAGYTLQTEEPVVVEDFEAEDRFDAPALLVDNGAQSGISTIIGSVENPWGIFETHDTAVQEFSEEDVNFVQSVANVLADAIERERYDAEREQLVADLAASNERLEQFAYAASHDLQEPLRMVSSYLSLIEDRYGDELDEDGREFLDYAVDGADRMQEMIDALLEYSRVERDADFESVDLDAVFADVCRDFEVKIVDNDATVVAESLPTVSGDEDQLRQVFGNLLSNAIEYGGDEPTVRVSAERGDREWVVSVSDDGIGIDPDHADRIFEVFQRLHTHDEHEGTGVGLALVQRIVERHGGDIWVESTPGEGATFYFSIPDRDQRDD
ncbi:MULTISPECIES: PAS domain-containing protein [Halobacterium]|uniref:PAS domain-containing protein n=1 Tax=Halobacterium TaxID=2239 RepID=UPI00073EC2D4|nr:MULTISPECIES: PAS domain-containing protein [Halobacterium]MCG1003343.1 PAS domain-containing protein [Halobacterium noricense]